MRTICLFIICALLFSGYTIQEKIDDVVVSSYESSDLSDLKYINDRDIYIDGALWEDNENYKTDFEVKFDKLLKAFALVVLDEINLLREDASLSQRSVGQLKTAVRNKYETL